MEFVMWICNHEVIIAFIADDHIMKNTQLSDNLINMLVDWKQKSRDDSYYSLEKSLQVLFSTNFLCGENLESIVSYGVHTVDLCTLVIGPVHPGDFDFQMLQKTPRRSYNKVYSYCPLSKKKNRFFLKILEIFVFPFVEWLDKNDSMCQNQQRTCLHNGLYYRIILLLFLLAKREHFYRYESTYNGPH